MAGQTVTISVTADTTAFKNALNGVAPAASSALDGIGAKAAAIGAGFATATAGVVSYGADAIASVRDLGGQVAALQRQFGGTSEEASRLAFAFSQTGVDVEAGGKALAIFSNQMSTAMDSGSAMGGALGKLGVQFLDANGSIKPMTELLPLVADKFASMSDGPEKTALAMQLFSESGADLLPFLNKGADGLAALAAKSDEFGMTLTGSQLQAVKDAKAADRDWTATMNGLQTQIGAGLLPVITSLVGGVRGNLSPAITAASAFIRDHGDIVVKVAGGILVGVGAIKGITSVTKLWSEGQALLNGVLNASPIMRIVMLVGVLIAAIVGLYNSNEQFRAFVDAAWKAIQGVISGVAGWITGTLVPGISGAWTMISGGATSLWNAMVGIWNGIVAAVQSAWAGIVGAVDSIVATIAGLGTAVGDTIAGVVQWFVDLPGQIAGAFSGAASWLFEAGKSIVQGLINGISNLAGSIGSFFLNLIPSWIVGPFKMALGIASPSRVMYSLMYDGVGAGLLTAASDLMVPISRQGAALAEAVRSGWTTSGLTLDADIPTLAASGLAGRNVTLNVNVNVPLRSSAADVGREVAASIEALYQQTGGRGR